MNKQALVFLAVILPTPALANQNTLTLITDTKKLLHLGRS
jgi:hypothetical protein|tara:strand:- start:979 stop:1098 length:120 start_codon:yes stop_codon:yes gene_type:complete